ncbi:MAG TPA: TatD family hydrolase [Bacteroidales bacterium]|nr:TatD family hydrolase [Bacteroidales bacterium]
MILTDTHTHLYLEQFDTDRDAMIQRALTAGVKYMLLPNIDSGTIPRMMDLCADYPEHLFPMIGLHPTDVKDNFESELAKISEILAKNKFYAIGETGIDLYWDKTFVGEQKTALIYQIQLAKQYELPVVLHVRNSFNEVIEVLNDVADQKLTGVFHCFTGSKEQADQIISYGFKLGIGGVLTYKNSGLDKVVAEIAMEHLLLETDSPFLAPVPYRGKRNESSYITLIAEKLASIKGITPEDVAAETTKNASKLFKFPQ